MMSGAAKIREGLCRLKDLFGHLRALRSNTEALLSEVKKTRDGLEDVTKTLKRVEEMPDPLSELVKKRGG